MDSANSMMAQNQHNEIELRNAASRAYYALFHTAMQLVLARGVTLIKVERGGSHESLIATLCGMSLPAKSIGEAIGRVKRFRHDCDYQVSHDISAKKVAMHIAESERLIARLHRLN
jgi:uncharacterized protein (UPF0332 family)